MWKSIVEDRAPRLVPLPRGSEVSGVEDEEGRILIKRSNCFSGLAVKLRTTPAETSERHAVRRRCRLNTSC